MPKNPLILLVDDETDFLNAVSLGLRIRNFDVISAESGSEALTLLEKHTPDVIIADLRMSPMNGFELYQQVRKNPKASGIRFFFLTGMKDSLAEKYGLTLGAEAYLLKPVDLDELEKAIKNALRTS